MTGGKFSSGVRGGYRGCRGGWGGGIVALAWLMIAQVAPGQFLPSRNHDGTGLSAQARALLTLENGDLIVGGLFDQAGDVAASRIARWDGSAWHPIGGGLDGPVNALVEYNGRIIAGGRFTQADGRPANRIAQWDGRAWQPLGLGINAGSDRGSIYALAVYKGDLIAGGWFQTAGSGRAASIARWDGNAWHRITSDDRLMTIHALHVHDGLLYAGGIFRSIDGVCASGIASWDGSTWRALGAGFNGVASAMTVHRGDLIVGGRFTEVGGNEARLVARWNARSSTWHPVGNGLGPVTGRPGWLHGAVFDLFVHNDAIFAGGIFTPDNEPGAPFVAMLDERSGYARWRGVGVELNNYVSTFAAHQGRLVAGGIFRVANDSVVNYITYLDSSATMPMTREFAGKVPATESEVRPPSQTRERQTAARLDRSRPQTRVSTRISANTRQAADAAVPPYSLVDASARPSLLPNPAAAPRDRAAPTIVERERVQLHVDHQQADRPSGSCADSADCGGLADDCWCDEACCERGDCCEDKWLHCGGCDSELDCRADLTGDGRIDVDDLLALLDAFGSCRDEECAADLVGDGKVGAGDVLELLRAWGICSPMSRDEFRSNRR